MTSRRYDIMDRGWKTPCWIWRGFVADTGYGNSIRIAGQRVLPHRAFYVVHVGPIPQGKQIDHLCRQRDCVNPDHLEPVWPRENVLRGEGLTAARAAQTHCSRGHELSGENLRIRADGHRDCRTCVRNRARNRRDRARMEHKESAA